MSRILRDLFIVPNHDEASAVVTFSPPDGCTGSSWRLLDQAEVIRQGDLPTTPGQAARLEIPMQGFRPWNVNTPQLYTLELTLVGDLSMEQAKGKLDSDG